MSRTQLESAVSGQAPRTLRVPGKIYVSGRYLFINEHYEGIHVFDNSDPSHPTEVQFLRIPGNLDMAVRGNLLYADNGPDLLTLDISNPTQIRVAGRTRNALPELTAPVLDFVIPTEFQPENRPKDAVIVGWELVKK